MYIYFSGCTSEDRRRTARVQCVHFCLSLFLEFHIFSQNLFSKLTAYDGGSVLSKYMKMSEKFQFRPRHWAAKVCMGDTFDPTPNRMARDLIIKILTLYTAEACRCVWLAACRRHRYYRNDGYSWLLWVVLKNSKRLPNHHTCIIHWDTPNLNFWIEAIKAWRFGKCSWVIRYPKHTYMRVKSIILCTVSVAVCSGRHIPLNFIFVSVLVSMSVVSYNSSDAYIQLLYCECVSPFTFTSPTAISYLYSNQATNLKKWSRRQFCFSVRHCSGFTILCSHMNHWKQMLN